MFWSENIFLYILRYFYRFIGCLIHSDQFTDEEYRKFVRERRIKKKLDKELDKEFDIDLKDF